MGAGASGQRLTDRVVLRYLSQEEDFEEDEGIYEDLHLDEEEDAVGLMQDHDDTLSESDIQSVSDGAVLLLCSCV